MRISAIALAIPLAVIGFACRTSGSYQGSETASRGTATSETSPQHTSGTSGTTPGRSADASGAVMAHSDDQVVSGRISQLSSDSVTITNDVGDDTTLKLVPQTTVSVDGSDASVDELKEGQPVRASFNQAEDENVAVQIQAGLDAGPQPERMDAGTQSQGVGRPEMTTGAPQDSSTKTPDDQSQRTNQR